MEKRVTSRAVIIENRNIILMKRRKTTDEGVLEYYSVIGGLIEKGETKEQAVLREAKEESNLDLNIIRYLGYIEKEDFKSHYFLCEVMSGKMNLGGEELEKNNNDNFYELVKIPLTEVEKLNILGKEKVLEGIKYLNG
jgi:8-oxo-dGTP diphosphatase